MLATKCIASLLMLFFLTDCEKEDLLKWQWHEDQKTLEYSISKSLADSDLFEVQTVQVDDFPIDFDIKIVRKKDKSVVYTWRGHKYTMFLLSDETLYYVDFYFRTEEAMVIAYDLSSGSIKWKTELNHKFFDHSLYLHFINMRIFNNHIIIYSNQSYAEYVHILNKESGKIEGYRQVLH